MPRTHRPETIAARRQRRQMPLPETLLWARLRRGATGVAFRRQHPIGPYIVDFCCVALRLVIEVDGQHHDRGERPGHDVERDAFLRLNGYDVIHLPARDILRDPDVVAASIGTLAARPLHHASGMVPLPAGGEDFR